MNLEDRIKMAMVVADHYSEFVPFCRDAMHQLGFSLSEMQEDIATYMAYGPDRRVVMAQRAEAKSTIGCIYALWRIIQNPAHRVLMVSQGDTQATNNSHLIIGLIMSWDVLEYLRPERSKRDRTSVNSFDVHWGLRVRQDRSPTLACMSIFGQLTGSRADTLISDDIETGANGRTAGQREAIALLSREFAAICVGGDLIYLGTPHTRESLYNRLPSRGFDVRIWPGRIPSEEQEERYGPSLAPYIKTLIERWGPECRSGYGVDGSRGRPTDPVLRDEDNLIEQELDHGPDGFELQFMLDSTLSDQVRQQLKLSDLIFADWEGTTVPEQIVWRANPSTLMETPPGFPVSNIRLYNGIIPEGTHWVKIPDEDIVMTIDPAGGGVDELAWAIGASLGPYAHVLHVGGLNGGLSDENGKHLIEVIKKYNVSLIEVESNMGHGLFEINLRAMLDNSKLNVAVVGKYATGQKEKRIIDSMVSPLQRHLIVIHPSALKADKFYSDRHGSVKGRDFSVFYQLENITYDRKSLVRDDRLDALAALIRRLKHNFAISEEEAAEARSKAEALAFQNNPMGYTGTAKPRAATPLRGVRKTLQKRRSRR